MSARMDSDVMRKIKVLQLQTDTGLTGGIATYISNLISSETYKSFSNIVIVPGMLGSRIEGITLYGDSSLSVLPKTYSFFYIFSYIKKLFELITKDNVDIVHAHAMRSGFSAAIVRLLFKIPFVYTTHGVRYIQIKSSAKRSIYKQIERFIYSQADFIVAIRPYDFNLLKSLNISSEKLKLIDTNINMTILSNTNRSLYPKTFIGVGSLIDIKRPELFIDWIEELVSSGLDVEGFWAGNGPLKEELERKVISRKIPVKFVGLLDKKGLDNLYEKSDFLLLTSKFEVFPMVVLEASAHGVPTISTKFDGVEDIIINNHTGLIADKTNIDYLIPTIIELISDNSKWKLMSDNARARFQKKHSNVDRMAKEYKKLYLSIFSKKLI